MTAQSGSSPKTTAFFLMSSNFSIRLTVRRCPNQVCDYELCRQSVEAEKGQEFAAFLRAHLKSPNISGIQPSSTSTN